MLAIERSPAAGLPRSLLWGENRDAFILPRFREFYAEVIRLKRRVRSAGAPVAVAAGERPGEEAANLVEQRLLGLLEQQALDCARLAGEPAAKLYKDAQYVMAALADETFLNLEWDGRGLWSSRLLEHR
ncbi:MAG: hypothetical protein HOP28_02675, partial [Gemmatimonadales bacterium]|nr:hypothetical protein [Gemmatimonadales bacterium]